MVYRYGQLRAQLEPSSRPVRVRPTTDGGRVRPVRAVRARARDRCRRARHGRDRPGTLTAQALADAAAVVDATLVFASPAALRNVVATAAELTPTSARPSAGSDSCCRPGHRCRPPCCATWRGVAERRAAHAVRDDRSAARDRHLAGRDRSRRARQRGLRRAATAWRDGRHQHARRPRPRLGSPVRRSGRSRRDLVVGRAREGPLRPAVGDRTRPARATSAGTGPATSDTSMLRAGSGSRGGWCT